KGRLRAIFPNTRRLSLDAVVLDLVATQRQLVVSLNAPIATDVDAKAHVERTALGSRVAQGPNPAALRHSTLEPEVHAVGKENERIDGVALAGAVLPYENGERAKVNRCVLAQTSKVRCAESSDHPSPLFALASPRFS